MLKLNKATYLDKLHACWLGKNIGGTLGAPFEGKREFLNVQGFTTPPASRCPMTIWICSWFGWLPWNATALPG